MRKLGFVAFAALALAGCGIEPVKLNTSDGSQRYFMECGEDRSGCFVKANEICPQGYEVLEAKETKQVSYNYWRGGTSTDATLHIRCKS